MSDGISYVEMLQQLQMVTVAEHAANIAWADVEDKVWREDLESSPHGRPWHTSFHASSLPGDPDTACGRKALYGIMDIPNTGPVDQQGRGIMAVGSAVEDMYVERYEAAGMLLSEPTTSRTQTGFSDFSTWLSGNLDAVIRPPGWNRGHVVEFKGKDHDKIDMMRRGEMPFHENHYFQLQAYLGFLQTESDRVYMDWAHRKITHNGILRVMPSGFEKLELIIGEGLTEPVTSGSILYFSRQRPRHTHEFYFDFDPKVWETASTFLKEWRQNFLDGELPPRNDWKWMQPPCNFCSVKKLCKADHKAGISRLEESGAIDFAKTLRPKYDYDEVRQSVLKRWENGL